MNTYFRPAEQRGSANFGWLESKHSFSFGNYYDPAHIGFSVLRVINDDKVAPGQGFPMHPHKDMEIITYIRKGSIEHKDSMGNHYRVPAGDLQRMSAGSGVTHSEYNPSDREELELLQIWIHPNVKGIKPEYEQISVERHGKVTTLASADGRDNSLTLHQDASLNLIALGAGETFELTTDPNRVSYLHVLEGTASVNGQAVKNADGLGLRSADRLTIETGAAAFEALWFDLPPD